MCLIKCLLFWISELNDSNVFDMVTQFGTQFGKLGKCFGKMRWDNQWQAIHLYKKRWNVDDKPWEEKKPQTYVTTVLNNDNINRNVNTEVHGWPGMTE